MRHVAKIKRDQEQSRESRNFKEAFEAARQNAEKKYEKGKIEENKSILVAMYGMSQYDSHAREKFFALSSQTDYTC